MLSFLGRIVNIWLEVNSVGLLRRPPGTPRNDNNKKTPFFTGVF